MELGRDQFPVKPAGTRRADVTVMDGLWPCGRQEAQAAGRSGPEPQFQYPGLTAHLRSLQDDKKELVCELGARDQSAPAVAQTFNVHRATICRGIWEFPSDPALETPLSI
ncbi:MAG: hypothetical protein OXC53_06610 [Rhodobacteraceae bacterium]|nr:hypothetical protein [Paracoccaceae bacterium]